MQQRTKTTIILQTKTSYHDICLRFVSNTKLLHYINQLYFSAVLVMDLWEVRRTIAPKTVKQLMAAQSQRTRLRGFG